MCKSIELYRTKANLHVGNFLKLFRKLGESQDGMQDVTEESNWITNVGNNVLEGPGRKRCAPE